MPTLTVDTRSFRQLFVDAGIQEGFIPDYQRPYTWSEAQAGALLDDLLTSRRQGHPEYYLGSVVLLRNEAERRYELIDGQQRVITLAIMHYCLDGCIPVGFDLRLHTQQSVANVKTVRAFFEACSTHLAGLAGVFDAITFTRVITGREDEAFTFFDTQNNRGVTLGHTDFLKAYHLREIASDEVQEHYAQQWELADRPVAGANLLATLFEQVLWRARRWRGQRDLPFASRERMLEMFQKQALPLSGPFPQAAGPLHRWQPPGEAASPPAFSLRQPIFKGQHFFDYAACYTEVFTQLFEQPGPGSDIAHLREFIGAVYSADMSSYLAQLLRLCLVVYYDCFGLACLREALHHFDYWIGSIRLGQQAVYAKTVTKALGEGPWNMIDLIIQAYLPEEVFAVIAALPQARQVYAAEAGKDAHRGVQGRYRQRLLDYFGQPATDFSQRLAW